jgi:hypothetical protein
LIDSFFSMIKSSIEKIRARSEFLPGVQKWPYYRDLAIQSGIKTFSISLSFKSSGHCTISSELASLRYSRLHRSLNNLIYTPNDELNYFILYMESCFLSSYLKFILDINTFEKLIRQNLQDNDQQTTALTLFHRYLSIDAEYPVPIDDEIRRTTLCKSILFCIIFILSYYLSIALICPSNNSTIPDPDCFRMAREHIWELIEQKFVCMI